jgi:AcrR family transcriptional regulator
MAKKNISEKDQRVQNTKKRLTEALIGLILKKGYENVTIQDLLDKAKVGRATFYAHYENKEQLLLAGHKNKGANLFSSKEKLSELMFLKLFQHVEENINLSKAMLGKRSGDIAIKSIQNNMAQRILEHYTLTKKLPAKDSLALRYSANATASAIASLLTQWINDDMPFSSIEMAKKCELIVVAFLMDFKK